MSIYVLSLLYSPCLHAPVSVLRACLRVRVCMWVFCLYVLRVTCLPAAGRNREREQRVREIKICWDPRKTLGDSWLGGVYSLCVYRTDYTHADTHTRVPVCIRTDSDSRDDTVCKFAAPRIYVLLCKWVLSRPEKHKHANAPVFFVLGVVLRLYSRIRY